MFTQKRYKKGRIDKKKDVFFAIPCKKNQLTSGQFGLYRACYKASRNYKKNDPINEKIIEDQMRNIRELIHEAKGILNEAKIILGEDYEIELSHHEGLENFKQVGTIIVNLFNKEYCKKLIILLHNQQHHSSLFHSFLF